MFKNLYNRFFPTPKFLEAPSFGLDISDESIKYVQLVNTAKGIKVATFGERKIPKGVMESGKILDEEKIEEMLVLLRKEIDIKSVRVSLPEEQVYLFNVKLNKEGLENIRESIELSLEEYIPVPAQDAIFDYEIVGEDDVFLHLQVAAIPENVIEEYLEVFKTSDIFVKSFELEAQAIARAVIKKDDKGTYMIVDFGKKRTGIFIVSKGMAIFTSTLDMGGSLVAEMIAKNFKIDIVEAEKKKQEFGLKRNAENTETFSVLLNAVSILRDEIVKHSIYWHTHKDEEGNDRPPIEKIILCGGDANMIGLSEYLSVSMKMKVEMVNSWININTDSEYVPEIAFNQSLAFASALGLALGDFEHD